MARQLPENQSAPFTETAAQMSRRQFLARLGQWAMILSGAGPALDAAAAWAQGPEPQETTTGQLGAEEKANYGALATEAKQQFDPNLPVAGITLGQTILDHVVTGCRAERQAGKQEAHGRPAQEVVRWAMNSNPAEFAQKIRFARVVSQVIENQEVVKAMYALVQHEKGFVMLIVRNPELLAPGSEPGTSYRPLNTQKTRSLIDQAAGWRGKTVPEEGKVNFSRNMQDLLHSQCRPPSGGQPAGEPAEKYAGAPNLELGQAAVPLAIATLLGGAFLLRNRGQRGTVTS